MPLLGKFGTATSRAFGFNGGNTATVPIPVPPGNIFNYDVYTNRGPTYVPGIANNITVTIPASTTVGSTSTGTYSLSVPSAFGPLDTVTIVNNGVIQGMGGAGGAGRGGVNQPAGPGNPGAVGGNAIFVARPTTITNNGVVAGGGGGGGGGAAPSAKLIGGAGGGGAGLNGGAPNGTSPAGGAGSPGNSPGGAGGGRGAAGSNGSAPNPAFPGGAGGGAGSYLVGSPFVTWPVTGTRQGNVS